MNFSARLATVLLGLGRGRAVAAIVGASVAGSLLLTVLSLWLLPSHDIDWPVPVTIATLVPLLVATPVALGLMSLLRELERARQDAHRLANTDLLTGLYNRRRWMDIAEQALRRAAAAGEPVVLMMLDVDHFKNVNDVHGHIAGDAVLRAVADACRATLQESHAVARWGGEEFVLLLPGIAIDTAAEIAESVRRAVAAQVVHSHGCAVTVTASLGVAWSDDPAVGHDLDRLLHYADCAMYTAKAAGRDCIRTADPSQTSKNGRFRTAGHLSPAPR